MTFQRRIMRRKRRKNTTRSSRMRLRMRKRTKVRNSCGKRVIAVEGNQQKEEIRGEDEEAEVNEEENKDEE